MENVRKTDSQSNLQTYGKNPVANPLESTLFRSPLGTLTQLSVDGKQ